jgi:hypothetical protein
MISKAGSSGSHLVVSTNLTLSLSYPHPPRVGLFISLSMHESWHDGQLSTFDDKYAEWDVFSVERASSEGTSRFERRLLHPNDIESWLESHLKSRTVSACCESISLLGGPRNLILSRRLTRHRNAGSADLKQSFIPLKKDHFATLERRYGVPPSYLYLRANANASGAFARYTTRDEDGNATRIGRCILIYRIYNIHHTTIRPPSTPHAPQRFQVHLVDGPNMGRQKRPRRRNLRRTIRPRHVLTVAISLLCSRAAKPPHRTPRIPGRNARGVLHRNATGPRTAALYAGARAGHHARRGIGLRRLGLESSCLSRVHQEVQQIEYGPRVPGAPPQLSHFL